MGNDNQALFESCLNEDILSVEKILQRSIDFEYRDEQGRTALMVAVQKNNYALVKLLLEAGFSPNARDNTMLPPFICAAANGFYDILELMFRYGADKTLVNRFGGTALLPSSERGFLRTVEIAIDNGVNVNHINDLGWSALEEAVILGDGGILYQDVIRTLIEAGADTNVSDNQNIPIKTHAKNLGQAGVASMLDGRIHTLPAPLEECRKLARKGKYRAALELLNQSHGLPDILVLYYQGYYHSLMQDDVVAAEYFQSGLAITPEFYFYLANCYRRLHQCDQALKAFDDGIRFSDRPMFFRYHKSNYLRDLGLHQQAIAEMDLLLQESPNRYDYSFHRANSLRSLGRHYEAIEEIQRAIRSDPTNPLFPYHQGQSYFLLQQYEKAIPCFMRAVSLQPKAIYWIEIAKCYSKLQQNYLAVDALKKGQELEPDDLAIQELIHQYI